MRKLQITPEQRHEYMRLQEELEDAMKELHKLDPSSIFNPPESTIEKKFKKEMYKSSIVGWKEAHKEDFYKYKEKIKKAYKKRKENNALSNLKSGKINNNITRKDLHELMKKDLKHARKDYNENYKTTTNYAYNQFLNTATEEQIANFFQYTMLHNLLETKKDILVAKYGSKDTYSEDNNAIYDAVNAIIDSKIMADQEKLKAFEIYPIECFDSLKNEIDKIDYIIQNMPQEGKKNKIQEWYERKFKHSEITKNVCNKINELSTTYDKDNEPTQNKEKKLQDELAQFLEGPKKQQEQIPSEQKQQEQKSKQQDGLEM